MKRSDIKNAYDRMNPTREQKDRMLRTILENSETDPAHSREFHAQHTADQWWHMIPAAAVLVLVVSLGIFLLGRTAPDDRSLSTGDVPDGPSAEYFLESPQLQAGQEWYQFLREYAGTSEDDLFYPYSTWGCENNEMAAKLDEICAKYSLTFPDQEERMTDALYYLLDVLEIENVLDAEENVTQTTKNCAWWDDGQFFFSGTTTLDQEDCDWVYPVNYVFWRTYSNVFLHSFTQIGLLSDYDCWVYTDENGMDLLLAVGANMGFILAEMGNDVIFVEIENAMVGDIVYGERTMDRAAMESFAETFRFVLTPAQKENSTVTEIPAGEEEDALDRYRPVLDLYAAAVREKWNLSQCAEAGISVMASYFGEEPDKLGYALMDLDLNGNKELLITDGEVIYDLYTLNDDGPVQIFAGGERNVYYLRDGFRILNRGSRGAANTVYTWGYCVDGELVTDETIVYNAELDPDNPWFHMEGDSDVLEPITAEEADEILNSNAELMICFTPITE